LSTQKHFSRLVDSSKQEVLINFIQNKAVLRTLYDAMFCERAHSESPLRGMPSVLDFNKLILQH